jgi:hypothetical protein
MRKARAVNINQKKETKKEADARRSMPKRLEKEKQAGGVEPAQWANKPGAHQRPKQPERDQTAGGAPFRRVSTSAEPTRPEQEGVCDGPGG